MYYSWKRSAYSFAVHSEREVHARVYPRRVQLLWNTSFRRARARARSRRYAIFRVIYKCKTLPYTRTCAHLMNPAVHTNTQSAPRQTPYARTHCGLTLWAGVLGSDFVRSAPRDGRIAFDSVVRGLYLMEGVECLSVRQNCSDAKLDCHRFPTLCSDCSSTLFLSRSLYLHCDVLFA